MKKYVLLCLAVFSPTLLQAQVCTTDRSEVTDREETSCQYKQLKVNFDSRFLSRKVLYALPDTPKPKAGYPVVFIYQGSFFEVEFSRTEGLPFGGYNEIKLIEQFLNRGFAVIAPRAFKRLFWTTNTPILSKIYDEHADRLLMQKMLEQVKDGTYGPLDTKNIFATGISSGGYQSSRVGIEFPGVFNAIAIESASYATCVGPLCDIPEELPKSHPPTLLLHGAEDKTVPICTAEKYFEILKKNGIYTEMFVDKKAGHEWLTVAPKMIPDFFTQYLK